jgi:hypothetical protein
LELVLELVLVLSLELLRVLQTKFQLLQLLANDRLYLLLSQCALSWTFRLHLGHDTQLVVRPELDHRHGLQHVFTIQPGSDPQRGSHLLLVTLLHFLRDRLSLREQCCHLLHALVGKIEQQFDLALRISGEIQAHLLAEHFYRI